MKLKLINKKLLIKTLIFFSWISMWVSINSMPGELFYMNKDIITFFNGMRTINVLIFCFFISLFALYYLFDKNLNKNPISVILIIYLIYFISQFAGLLLNKDRIFDLNNTYLVIYSIGTISLLYLINKFDFDDLIPLLMYFLIFILTVSVIFIVIKNLDKIPQIVNEYNLYYFLHPDVALNYQAPPRITGFSRTISIINLFLMIIFLINLKKIYSYPLIFIIYLLSVIIWLSQSRGTIICYYVTSFILIFFLNNLKIYKKILIYFIITIFSILSANFITYKNISNPTDKKSLEIISDEIEKEKIEIEEKLTKENSITSVKEILTIENSRFYTTPHSSGRTELWKKSLQRYDKQKIFGYGPQADRILLYDQNHVYSNNVSNAVIYAFLSGGYPALICIILIYFYFSYLAVTFFFREKLYKFSFQINKKNSLIIAALAFSIFFMLRSIIENSFSLFSIDFLITIFSLFVIEKFKNKKFIN